MDGGRLNGIIQPQQQHDASPVNLLGEDDDEEELDDDGEEEHGSLTRGIMPLNLILVMNMNVKVVLCDCGKAYKLPDVISSAASCGNKENAAEMGGSIVDCTTSTNNRKPGCEKEQLLTEIVCIKDGLKVRY